jgi:hypothetical protein
MYAAVNGKELEKKEGSNGHVLRPRGYSGNVKGE